MGMIVEKKLLSRDKIVGKQVIDSNGTILGTVKDITFDLAQSKMSITIADEKGKETEVSSDDVSAVGDVVLLKRPREAEAVGAVSPRVKGVVEAVEAPPRPSPPTGPAPQPSVKAPTSPGLCPNCGYQNEPASRFCIKCGTRLR